MNAEIKALAYLLNTVEAAIQSGDWKVDGACDPDLAIKWAEICLNDAGYTQIDGEWKRGV